MKVMKFSSQIRYSPLQLLFQQPCISYQVTVRPNRVPFLGTKSKGQCLRIFAAGEADWCFGDWGLENSRWSLSRPLLLTSLPVKNPKKPHYACGVPSQCLHRDWLCIVRGCGLRDRDEVKWDNFRSRDCEIRASCAAENPEIKMSVGTEIHQ